MNLQFVLVDSGALKSDEMTNGNSIYFSKTYNEKVANLQKQVIEEVTSKCNSKGVELIQSQATDDPAIVTVVRRSNLDIDIKRDLGRCEGNNN